LKNGKKCNEPTTSSPCENSKSTVTSHCGRLNGSIAQANGKTIVMRQRTYGIVPEDDGSYMLATCEQRETGWRLLSINRWSGDNAIKNAFLFNKGITAAVPCRWVPSAPHPPDSSDAMRQAAGIHPIADDAVLIALDSRLRGNLVGTIPDDAFLCTIPIGFSPNAPPSFVSIFRADSYYKIGIITSGTLQSVFSMAPADPALLERHLGRIQRFTVASAPNIVWPKHLFLLNCGDVSVDAGYTIVKPDLLTPGIDISDLDVLRATGAAVSAACGFTPYIAPASPESAFRNTRTAVYSISAAICLICLALMAAIPIASLFAAGSLDSYKQRYRQVLAQTPELQSIMAHNDSLARAVLLAHQTNADKTQWTSMLETLGTLRPEGLYFDMIGTEGAATTGKTSLALSGWAHNESQITDLIASLSRSGLYTGISLSSLERNIHKNLVMFRIICTYRLSGGLPRK
jgi:Tfp pilus assembly protein PilN